jgi:N-methylhydantoinase A
MAAPRRIRVGIDTGGTFTDVVAVDEGSGEIATTKTPSTPSNPADGFIAGIEKILGILGAAGRDLVTVSHGTTVATNKLLEGKVERLGFVTTEGYEFMLEIARQAVPDGYGNSYFWVKPPRIVPADAVRTVRGRLDASGAEVRPFSEEDAVAAARWFRDRDITTIGVCFLHSYADDTHELAMREVLRREHPEAVVSISSEVLREYREYERAMTTLVDAAVKPSVSRYVANIHERLDALWSEPGTEAPEAEHGDADPTRGIGGSGGERGGAEAPRGFFVMKSNGGVLSADEVARQPITTVLSGPAAGALGAALVAQRAGFDRVLTCDGGGTSTDVTVVLDGEPTLTTEGSVGVYPSKIPMIDVVTVGAGGGSIAWVSPEGALKVGPQSAGADPGPLCYGQGGTEPTITDAHVLLGRIPPHLLGGEIPLDADAARTGLAELAGRLGLDLERCAAGVLEISAWNQANALRQVSVKRGLDVRDFMLTTFGGSGSLLACRLVDVLDLAGVVVPLNPGNLSAFGLLTVDVRNDYVQTHVERHASLDLEGVGTILDELTARARSALDGEGFDRDDQEFVRTADLRYFGQAYEVRVPAGSGAVDPAWSEEVVARFHDEHRRLYGYDFRDDPSQQVEWVNLRVTGIGPITRPEPQPLPARGPDGASGDDLPGQRSVRDVCFDPDDGYVTTPVLWRPDLRAGDSFTGPAIVEEFGSTVPVHPGFAVRVDAWGNLVITKEDPR